MQLIPGTQEPLLQIVHEDDDLLVVNKPAGLVCHPTKDTVFSSLIGRARVYLGEEASIHIINRLDRETGGIVVLAKNSKSAGELGKLWERRGVEKEYVAIVHGDMPGDSGTIDAPLGKDTVSPVAIKDCVSASGTPATTQYYVLNRFARAGQTFSHLRVLPLTGRKHQIRIHMNHTGHPIVGDKIYGPDEQIYLRFVVGQMTDEDRQKLILDNHALYAVALRWCWRNTQCEFRTDPDAAFNRFAHGG